MTKIVAVLSSTVISRTGSYDVQVGVELPQLEGIPSFVGHPDTAAILAKLGVVPQAKGALFGGLDVGESFVAFPMANPDRSSGWTVDAAVADISHLRVTLVTRTK